MCSDRLKSLHKRGNLVGRVRLTLREVPVRPATRALMDRLTCLIRVERLEDFRVAFGAIKLQADHISKLYKRAEFTCHNLSMTEFRSV